MKTPMDGFRQMEDQFRWVEQVLGPDFWTEIRESIRGTGQAVRGRVAGPEGGGGSGSGGRTGPGHVRPPAPGAGSQAGPQLDLWITPREVVVSLALPGLAAPEQVAVSLTGPNQALIEAFLEPRPAPGIPIIQERPSGAWIRPLSLPGPESGIQVIHVPGPEQQK